MAHRHDGIGLLEPSADPGHDHLEGGRLQGRLAVQPGENADVPLPARCYPSVHQWGGASGMADLVGSQHSRLRHGSGHREFGCLPRSNHPGSQIPAVLFSRYGSEASLRFDDGHLCQSRTGRAGLGAALFSGIGVSEWIQGLSNRCRDSNPWGFFPQHRKPQARAAFLFSRVLRRVEAKVSALRQCGHR